MSGPGSARRRTCWFREANGRAADGTRPAKAGGSWSRGEHFSKTAVSCARNTASMRKDRSDSPPPHSQWPRYGVDALPFPAVLGAAGVACCLAAARWRPGRIAMAAAGTVLLAHTKRRSPRRFAMACPLKPVVLCFPDHSSGVSRQDQVGARKPSNSTVCSRAAASFASSTVQGPGKVVLVCLAR
jgi:hypothetical protein